MLRKSNLPPVIVPESELDSEHCAGRGSPRVLTTRPNFGGVRWWFQCPWVINDHPCKRRVGKLYLPPRGMYFGCRHCYDLTYTSAQEAHKWEGLYRMLAASMQGEYPGITGREVGQVLNGHF